MKYKELYVGFYSAWGRIGFYEIIPIDKSGRHLPHRKLSFALCREKGLIKRYDHTKKVNEYLATKEGQDWFDEVSTGFSC